MADYITRTVVTTRREWIVNTGTPWGVAAAEIGKAWAVAERAYREVHDVPKETPLHDDALRFQTRDDQIVISFAVEEIQR